MQENIYFLIHVFWITKKGQKKPLCKYIGVTLTQLLRNQKLHKYTSLFF